MSRPYRRPLLLATLLCNLAVLISLAQNNDNQPARLSAHWDKVVSVSKTTATLR